MVRQQQQLKSNKLPAAAVSTSLWARKDYCPSKRLLTVTIRVVLSNKSLITLLQKLPLGSKPHQ